MNVPMKTLTPYLTLSLLLVASFSHAQISGQWFFFDIAKNEKFNLEIERRKYLYADAQGGLLGRRFVGEKLKYRREGSTVEFYDKASGDFVMAGTLLKGGTEMSGRFANGDRFVAKHGYKPVYQVVWKKGEFKNRIFCLFDGDDGSSVELECKNTGGRSVGKAGRFDDSPANWLLKPNTFLDYDSCKVKADELMAQSNCGVLRGGA